MNGTTSTFAGDISIPVAKKLYFGGGSHTYIYSFPIYIILGKSPIFSHISITLDGRTSIRVYRKEPDFIKKYHQLQDLWAICERKLL